MVIANMPHTNFTVPNVVCDTTQLTAGENELYYNVCPRSGPIPANFQYNRTIVADPGRNIQVYLKVLETSTTDQCVQLIDVFDSSRITEVICAQSGQELYQSTGSSVSVTYPGKQMNTQEISFQVYYMLKYKYYLLTQSPFTVPIVNCNTTQLTAVLDEQYYEVYAQEQIIYKTFKCKRTIAVEQDQKMRVYLKVSNASSADQCVQVTDQLDSSQTSYVICAQSGQELYQSTGSVVTVTYPGKNTTTRITSFQVFYQLTYKVNVNTLSVKFALSSIVVCDTTQLTAGENELYYDVCPQPGPIPTNFQCNRTIVADPGRNIQVYLKVLETSTTDQCVQLIDVFDSSRITEGICPNLVRSCINQRDHLCRSCIQANK
ncbi:hypothetical protein FGIG_09996 [Fasciola gigantica]|uniref:CUB domain-containing protein n=1 Tax=Fasciola gigantica TaxID=46835 RepID=A0A504YYL3_FASGI|nr:hypothetical protein FGIG_09996 [Fasciola gigantica]